MYHPSEGLENTPMGQKRLTNLFGELVIKESFQKEVRKIRKKHDIPIKRDRKSVV